jgi:hypothetical protein
MRILGRILGSRVRKKLVCLGLAGLMLSGCAGTDKTLRYAGEANFDYYEDQALRIVHPDVDEPTPENVAVTQQPRTITDRSRDEVWNVSLAEVLHLALVNNRVIRVRGDFRNPGSALFSMPDQVGSVFDPSIRDSGVLFGGRVVEAAL